MDYENDSLKNQPKSLEKKQDIAILPPTPVDDRPVLTAAEAERSMHELLGRHLPAIRNSPPPRKRRYVGRLETKADIHREVLARYKEAYYGYASWENVAHSTYMLSVLLRTIGK